VTVAGSQPWPPISVAKERKLAAIISLLGPTEGLRCLDIGGDNGVVSHLLRQRGGHWASADLDDEAVASIRALVGDEVYRVEDHRTPFRTDEFDRVVVVDALEHLPGDREFIEELFRITRPGGELIVNVPHVRNGFLRRIRLAVGQTDEKHGHVRPGYTVTSLEALLCGRFRIVGHRTYSRAFAESVDIATRLVAETMKKPAMNSVKGVVLVKEDFDRHGGLMALYSLVRPLLGWLVGLDSLLPASTGYMLIARAVVLKPATR
jgi:SAM-dependent methyltransferase